MHTGDRSSSRSGLKGLSNNMDTDDIIPGLPNELVHCKVLPEICWWDFAAAASVNKHWRAVLSESHGFELSIPPQVELPAEIREMLELGSRWSYGSLVLGNKVLIAAGQSEDCIAMDQVDIFDLEKRRWESLPTLATPLSTCFMGVLPSLTASRFSKIVALGGVKSDDKSFWVESAQILSYGDHEWTEVESGDIPKLLESFSYVSSEMSNLEMLSMETGGLAKALIISE